MTQTCPKYPAGFTLIELILTLSLVAIISAIAIPSFNKFIESHRNRELARQMLGNLNYARSIAVSKQLPVALCASQNANECSGDQNWSSGGIIFIDNNKNARRDNDEELLQILPAAPHDGQLVLHGGLLNYLRYKPDGQLSNAGYFSYCPPNRMAESGWIVVFFWTGRPYFGRDSDKNGVAENGSGINLSC